LDGNYYLMLGCFGKSPEGLLRRTPRKFIDFVPLC
jgi:hypothetical protein